MELPRVLEVGEVLGHRPSRHVFRNHLRSLKQEGLLGFYMAAQRFASDAAFGEAVDEALAEPASAIVTQFSGCKTVKKALKDSGALKAVAEKKVTGITFGQAQRAVLAELTSVYRQYEESDAADELFNMLAVLLADGAGIDVSGLHHKDADQNGAADEAVKKPALTLIVPGREAGGPDDGVLANESGALAAPPHTPRGRSVDLSGKKSAALVDQIISKRSSLRKGEGSIENLAAAGENAGEKRKSTNLGTALAKPCGGTKSAVHRIAFNDVVYNPLGVEMIRTFMHTEHNEENLHFHLAVRAFRRRVQSRADMVKEAEALWTRFMDEASPEEVTISAALKKALRANLDSNPSTTSFDSTDRSVVKTMLSDVFRRFTGSELHHIYVSKLEDLIKVLQRKDVVHRRGKSVQLHHADGRGDVSLEDVVMDNELLSEFMQFCANEYSEEGILFWCACDEYLVACQRGAPAEERLALAREIEQRHLVAHAPYEVAIDSPIKRRCSAKISAGECGEDLFSSMQETVFSALKSDSFPRFIESPGYRRLRQMPASTNRGFFSCVSCIRKK